MHKSKKELKGKRPEDLMNAAVHIVVGVGNKKKEKEGKEDMPMEKVKKEYPFGKKK